MYPTPATRSRAYAQRVKFTPLPAPTEGWDDESPLSGMSPKRAVVLDNWFPHPSYVALRNGFAEHSDTEEGAHPVDTVMPYHGAQTTRLFAACNGKIFDVTNTSAAVSTVTSLSNSRLQYVNFTTSGGHYLYCVNGEDNPVYFDGTSWATPAITGVDESSFININVFKDRLYFVPVGDTKFWYLPIDSIAGAASSFELGGVMSLGGYLVAMGTVTIDGGAGPDDHAVFVTSKGQVIVYQGSDPSDANVWSLVGVYNIAPPIGRRCFVKIAGDLGILTISGLLPLSKAMVVDRAAVTNIALTSRINNTMTNSARSYSENFGWEVCVYPKGNMCIVNVPLQEGITQHQYVMNTLHGAWARFKGQAANCWAVYQDRLFFGGNDGKVYEADIAAQDGGEPITADMKTAFNFYGSTGELKKWQMIQTLITSDGKVSPGVAINVDFTNSAPTYIPASEPVNAIYWNQFNWNQANWPYNRTVSQKWQSVTAPLGRCAAIYLRVVVETTSSSPITMQVNGFNVTYEKGSFL